jgi:hypothetical protein
LMRYRGFRWASCGRSRSIVADAIIEFSFADRPLEGVCPFTNVPDSPYNTINNDSVLTRVMATSFVSRGRAKTALTFHGYDSSARPNDNRNFDYQQCKFTV